MEILNLLLSDTDFVEAWENFSHYHRQTYELLAQAKNSESQDKTLLYAEAVQAHLKAIEEYTRMNQLVLRYAEIAKPYLDALLRKS